MLCHTCGECLLEQSKSVFICNTCTTDLIAGDAVYFCLKCKKSDKHEHKLSKLKEAPAELVAQEIASKESLNPEEKNQYLESLLEEYYNLDFEDLIGGGSVKTRFKYRKVAPEDFGLTEEEILLLDDKQLNKLVSLKKYRPYIDTETSLADEELHGEKLRRKREEISGAVNLHRVKHLKKQF